MAELIVESDLIEIEIIPNETTATLTVEDGKTIDYLKAINKPSINGHELVGDKTASELDLAHTDDIRNLTMNLVDIDEKVDREITRSTDEDRHIENQIDVINQTIIDDKAELVSAIGDLAEDLTKKQDKGDYATNTTVTNYYNELTQDIDNIAGELDNKADKSEIPIIPTNISYFNNDSGYINSVKTINGQNIIGTGDIEIESASSFADLTGQPSDNTNLKNALDNKQDIINDLATIRSGAIKGATALQSIPLASTTTLGGIKAGNWLKVNAETGKLECGELTNDQYNSALGYTFISKTTLENVLSGKDYVKNTDYATGSKGGIFKPSSQYATSVSSNGYLTAQTIQDYSTISNSAFIGKGTLEKIKEDLVTSIGDNKYQNITDNTLATLDKTVVGAINELGDKIKEIELFKSPNVLIQGEPTINNGQVTELSKTNYLILPFEFDVKDRAFELTYCFRTGTDVTTPQNLFGSKFSIASYISGGKLTIRISNNGTSWDVLDLITTLDIQANTTYYIKIIFNKLSYEIKSSTDGVEYSQIGYVVDTRRPFAEDVFIGIGNNQNNPFLGMINLHKWELKYNNSVFWEGMDDAGLATRADISLSNLDEIGQAKFDAKQDKLQMVTYAELVSLRDNSQLKEGTYYRITDYVTTTNGNSADTSEPSRSAGHPFDIIIQAIEKDQLSEIGTCALHEGDTYFAEQNISAWVVYYNLDNDSNKYAWAVTDGTGKGVIYRMLDENKNEFPYDFKNIQFYRDKTKEKYATLKDGMKAPDGYYFTITNMTGTNNSDLSLLKGDYVYDNVMLRYTPDSGAFANKQVLNNTISIQYGSRAFVANRFGYCCCNNTMAYHISTNIIDHYFHDNVIGNDFYHNNIGAYFYNNIIGNEFSYNGISGGYFYDNIIGNRFKFNGIGSYFDSNTIGDDFYQNNIGTFFTSNTIKTAGNHQQNTIGNKFTNNTINARFFLNNIHDYFTYNTINAQFRDNVIGDYVQRNNFNCGFSFNETRGYSIQYTDIGITGKTLSNVVIKGGIMGSTNARVILDNINDGITTYVQTVERDENDRLLVTHLEGDMIIGKYKESLTSTEWKDLVPKITIEGWDE